MKTIIKTLFLSSLLAGAIGTAMPSMAAVPEGINYQAFLTNADGSAVDTNLSITFAAYNVDIGGVPLWSETQNIAIEQGLFSITLGNPANPFPAGLFDTPIYIGMFVAGEEMMPRRALSSSSYAFKSADSELLNGVPASALDQSSAVTTLQNGVSNNDSRLSNLESVGADITGVTIGPGLIGGGSMGDVVLGVAPGGIDATHIAPNSINSAAIINGQVGTADLAPNSVTSANIADGAVNATDINPTDAFNFQEITVDDLTATGATIFDSVFDMRIHDDFHGLRWYKSDGITQMASFQVRDVSVDWFDNNQTRTILRSNANGIGIGTTSIDSEFDVTVPSLAVSGLTDIGLEIVSSSYDLDSTTPQCHSHGNLPCFYGSTTVQCPVGKKVIGGGASGATARYGSVSQSLPSGVTGWSCGASYDIASATRTCYAVCARLN